MSEKMSEGIPFYNQKIQLSKDSEVSVALILAVVLGAASVLGMGIMGFLLSAVGAAFITAWAVYSIYKHIDSTTPDDPGGFLIALARKAFIFWFAITFVNFAVNLFNTADVSATQTAIQRAVAATNLDQSDPGTDYTVGVQPAREIAPVNPLIPMDGGYAPPAPAQPAQPAQPATTATPLQVLTGQLEREVTRGDRSMATQYAENILAIEPDNAYALAVLKSIDEQVGRFNDITQAMPLTGRSTMNQADYAESKRLLKHSGFTFRVESNGAERWDMSCNEWATLSIVESEASFWVYGNEFPIIRCILMQLADDTPGKTFIIR